MSKPVLGIKQLFQSPLTWLFLAFFLITSWPFVGFPLTDGDVAHWVPWAQDIALHGNPLSAKSDQSHGPMLAWGTGVLIRLFSLNYYILNLFNLLCGLGAVVLVYAVARKLRTGSDMLPIVAGVFAATNFMLVYLSRTPMYDLPAAFGFTLFCYAYAVYLTYKQPKWLALALLGLGFGSLSRFIIVIGLSCFFVLIMQFLHRQPHKTGSAWALSAHLGWMRTTLLHGCLIFGTALLLSAPWLWIQHAHHEGFLKFFIYDNFLRFLGDEKGVSRDYYGFLLITFIGLIPTTPILVSGLSKSMWQKWGKAPIAHVALAASVPCLLFFSFSGHTKLVRYIAYIFPSLLLLSGHIYTTCISDPVYRKRMAYWYYGLLSVVGIVLAIYAVQFNQEAQQSALFVGSAIVFLLGLISSALFFLVYRYTLFLQKPFRYVAVSAFFYLFFFTVLAMVYTEVPFLFQVRDMIDAALKGHPHA